MFKKYHLIRQYDIKDCGVCCLLSIVKHYKGDISLEVLREYTKTTKKGTTAYNVVDTAKQLGFAAYGLKGDINDLIKSNTVLPLIAHVTINKSYNHYVVIYNINLKKKEIIVGDPSSGIKKYNFEDFNNIWSGVIIVLYPLKKLISLKHIKLRDYIFDTLKKFRKSFLAIMLLSFLITIVSVINSFYFKIIIDDIVIFKSLSNLRLISFLFLVLIMFKTITDLFRKKLLLFINKQLDISIFFDVFKHIINLPYQYYKNRTTGEIVNRINDLNHIRDVVSKVILTLCFDLFLVIIAAIFLYKINSTLFFVSLIIALSYGLIIFIFSDIFDSHIFKIKETETDLNSFLIESISNFETIKGLNINDEIIGKGYLKYNSYVDEVYSFNNCYNFQSFFKDFINASSIVLVLFIGCTLTIRNEISIGTLISYNALLIYFLEPFKNLIDLESMLRYSKTIIRRVIELYGVECEKIEVSDKVIEDFRGNIVINKLSFSYNDRDYILNNITFEVKDGEKVLLIGESGSGKSTLLKLIMRYYTTTNGQIIINNMDINNYNLLDIRNNICYVSQNEKLFNDSIYNNIVLGGKFSYSDFLNISDICFVSDIYKNNPLGYDALIEEEGFNISGGERQRVVIARTLIVDRKIYIFDESMNELDIELERKILMKMFNLKENKTIIMTSHRLNNKDLFDKIIYLADGIITKVVEKKDIEYGLQ